MLSLFLPIELLCRSCKKYIAATVEGGFDGVLDDTEDETYSDLLHSLGVDDADIRFDNFGG